MQEIILFILGAAFTSIAFLVKRWIQKDRLTEEISRKERLAHLAAKMAEHGMTLEDLQDLENSLIHKRQDLREIEDTVTAELAAESRDLSHEMTQLEMNEAASLSFKRANEKMENIIAKLKIYHMPSEFASLEEAQSVWETYRDKQASFAASQFEGGSMQPMIYSGELERITIERTALLRDYFEFISEVHEPQAED